MADEKCCGETQTSTAEYLDVFKECRQVLMTKLLSEVGFARDAFLKIQVPVFS